MTLWRPDDVGNRLVDGSVNLTYGESERRTLDLSLSNTDNLLRPSPEGFWYDKVIKTYRGISYSPTLEPPRAVILEAPGASGIAELSAYFQVVGLGGASPGHPGMSDSALADYDIVISSTGSGAATGAGALLKRLYDEGKSIITIGLNNTSAQVPFIQTTAKSSQWGIAQSSIPTEFSAGWTTEAIGAAGVAAQAVTGLQDGAVEVARWQTTDSAYATTAAVNVNTNGGKWFDLHLGVLNTSGNLRQLVANVIAWMMEGYGEWDTQIGEFTIDSISIPHFPNNISITARDYTKRCMNSKIESAMTFDSDTKLYDFVKAIAGNAGINKFRLSQMNETIGKEMSFDRGTARWELIHDATEAQGYEVFFDHEGYLVTRPYNDPTLGAPSLVFGTGPEGNLASVGRKVNDSRIYNNICVYGDPASGETRMPFFGQAKNEDPASPTSIQRIGDRYYSFASTFFTSQEQTDEYAKRLLGLHALESFEIDLQSISYPWVEVGEVASIIDPRASEYEPTQYLIDTATVPLSLGPMSMTAKRVIGV